MERMAQKNVFSEMDLIWQVRVSFCDIFIYANIWVAELQNYSVAVAGALCWF